MAQTIRLKRSALTGQAPTTVQLELGEVAINTADGNMYLKQDDQSGGINIRRFAMYHTDGAFGTGDNPVTITVNGTTNLRDTVNLGTEAADIITVNGTTVFNSGVTFSPVPTGTTFAISDNLTAALNASFGTSDSDQLNIISTSTFQGPLITTNTSTLASLIVTGATSTQGATTLGDSAGDTVTVNGNAVFNNSATMNGNVTLGNASTDAITINGVTTFTNNMTANGNTILGNAGSDTLTVNSTSTFAGPVTFNGGVSIQVGDTFTFDSLAFTDVHKFTIRNSSGTIVKAGWLLDTDANVAN